MSHILIVGGTGMLRGVSLYFAKHAFNVSVIARNQTGLDELILEKGESGFINPVRADYGKIDLLKEKISSAINDYGEIELCICWIHSTAPFAPYVIADRIDAQKIKAKYYHVLPCESAEPANENYEIEKSFEKYKNLSYKKIILGFIVDSGKSRWLSNEEISNGVIDAVLQEKSVHIIGQTFPRDLKP